MKRGFTLIELLVVLAILATLLTLAVPRYFNHVEKSKEAVLKENLASIRDAIDKYHADLGVWPPNLTSLADRRYLRVVPVDPITEFNDTWQLIPPPDGSAGIYDVRSGAEGTATNGQPYNSW